MTPEQKEIQRLHTQVVGMSFAMSMSLRHKRGAVCICDALCAILDGSRFRKVEWGGYISVLSGMTLEYNEQRNEIARLQKIVTAQAEE